MSTACHIIALTHLGHEDEEEARDVLAKVEEEQGLEGSPLWRMIDEIVAALEQMREENRAS